MKTVSKPQLALTIALSDCYGSADSDPTLVEMLGRVLYHVTLNCFYISVGGKFHRDTAEYDDFLDHLIAFSRKSQS